MLHYLIVIFFALLEGCVLHVILGVNILLINTVVESAGLRLVRRLRKILLS